MKKGIRLATILRKVEMVHLQHPIIPAREEGYVNRTNGEVIDSHQTRLEFGNRPIRDKNRQILGDFYEFMTAGFYGGVIRRNIEVAKSAYVEPDVLNRETRQGFESKACHTSESLKLDDHQIQRYCRLQHLMQDYDFYFTVYKHSLKSLMNYEQENLFPALSDKTIGSIVLPLSLVLQMNRSRDNEIVYRYDGDKWCHTTAIRSHTLNRFFGDSTKRSEETVVEEFGLDPDDYCFQRLRSPLAFSVKGNRIKYFPVMFISDKNHEKWIEWFLENCQIQEEEIPF